MKERLKENILNKPILYIYDMFSNKNCRILYNKD